MPLKKATSKRAPRKVIASSEVFNNGKKEVAEEIATDAKNLPNGTLYKDTADSLELPKSKATRRNSERAKNFAPLLETEGPTKKPVTKSRGKKKSNENKVIENETDDSTLPENQEVEETKASEDFKTMPKGRGGGKNSAKKTKKAKDDKNVSIVAESVKDDSTQAEEAKLPEKNTKGASGRKKRKDILSKTVEQTDIKNEIEPDAVVEKASKKHSGNSKIGEDITAEIEPQKKKGRTLKKDKPIEEDDGGVTLPNEIKADVKDKKPIKRGRAATKAVIASEHTPDIVNGDAEEVLPKKRSRNVPSVEKELVKQKSSKGRAKKSDKIIEQDTELQTAKSAANGQASHEKTVDLEETPGSNKKAAKQTEPAAHTSKSAAAKSGRKRAAPSANNKKTSITIAEDGEKLDDGVDNAELEDEADGSKSSKSKKGKADTALLNATETKYDKADFDLPPPSDGQTVEEPRFNFKISSWNVAGLRSWIKKDGLKFLDYEEPDIFCMQETKCTNDQLPEEVVPIPGYHPYWLCMPGGYAGVAIYSKIMPINVEYGIGNKEFDDCGRIITAEYEKFFLINVYVPNSGRKLVNLDARMKWEKLFQQYVQNLDTRKPVVICGDMNVSHQAHDLANPKSNTRSAGFTKEERDKMTELLSLGYIDTFRHLYPDRKGAYTYWTYMANARSRNVGWRLDYFIVSERFIKRVVDNCIRSQCMGSDHCPITLFLKL